MSENREGERRDGHPVAAHADAYLGGPVARRAAQASVDLYWLPLGAGGWFVRLNGRIYEAIKARLAGRRSFDLYHSALEVRVPEGRFIIEMAWPIPDSDGASRGVVVEGPVGSRRIAAFRVFRYELRRWLEGVIPDADEAVASPQRLTENPDRARRLLDLVGSVPRLVWGRDESVTGEMWNSNSVISWLIARSGLLTDMIRPPEGGRAPGWEAGLIMAGRRQRGDEGAAQSRTFTSIRRSRQQARDRDRPHREAPGVGCPAPRSDRPDRDRPPARTASSCSVTRVMARDGSGLPVVRRRYAAASSPHQPRPTGPNRFVEGPCEN